MELTEIAKNAGKVDSEAFHLELKNLIDRGEADGWLEAIRLYCESRDVQMDELHKMFTPTLKQLVEEEAKSLNLLKGEKKTATLPE